MYVWFISIHSAQESERYEVKRGFTCGMALRKVALTNWLCLLEGFCVYADSRGRILPSGFRSAAPMFNRNKLLWSTDSWVLIVVLQINKRHVTHIGPQLGPPVAVLFNIVLSLGRLLWDAGLHYSKADGCLCQGGPKCLKFCTPRPSFTSVQDLTNNTFHPGAAGRIPSRAGVSTEIMLHEPPSLPKSLNYKSSLPPKTITCILCLDSSSNTYYTSTQYNLSRIM